MAPSMQLVRDWKLNHHDHHLVIMKTVSERKYSLKIQMTSLLLISRSLSRLSNTTEGLSRLSPRVSTNTSLGLEELLGVSTNLRGAYSVLANCVGVSIMFALFCSSSILRKRSCLRLLTMGYVSQ